MIIATAAAASLACDPRLLHTERHTAAVSVVLSCYEQPTQFLSKRFVKHGDQYFQLTHMKQNWGECSSKLPWKGRANIEFDKPLMMLLVQTSHNSARIVKRLRYKCLIFDVKVTQCSDYFHWDMCA